LKALEVIVVFINACNVEIVCCVLPCVGYNIIKLRS